MAEASYRLRNQKTVNWNSTIQPHFPYLEKLAVSRSLYSNTNRMIHFETFLFGAATFCFAGRFRPFFRYSAVSLFLMTLFLNIKTCPSFLFSKHHTLNFLNYQISDSEENQQYLLNQRLRFIEENREEIEMFRREVGMKTKPVDVLASYLQEMNQN